MSGYFARLARKSIGKSLPRASGVTHAVTPLAHSVSGETPPAATIAFADKSPYPAATATMPGNPESDAIAQPPTATPAASAAPEQALNGAQPVQTESLSPEAAESGKREVQNLRSETPQKVPGARPFTEPQLEQGEPVRAGLEQLTVIAAPPSLSLSDNTDRVARTQPAAAHQPLGDSAPRPASADPPMSRLQPDRPQPRVSATPAESAARDQPRSRMARTAATRPTIDVRIGSLRIEVLPPPPPTTAFEAPRPQSAPAATQDAPSNFRPSRHYLRYGG